MSTRPDVRETAERLLDHLIRALGQADRVFIGAGPDGVKGTADDTGGTADEYALYAALRDEIIAAILGGPPPRSQADPSCACDWVTFCRRCGARLVTVQPSSPTAVQRLLLRWDGSAPGSDQTPAAAVRRACAHELRAALADARSVETKPGLFVAQQSASIFGQPAHEQ